MSYTIITERNQMGQFLTDLALTETVGYDLETNSLDWITGKIRLAQIEMNGNIYIFDLDNSRNPEQLFSYLIQLLDGSKVKVIAHNVKFEIKFTYAKTGILLKNVYDTQIAEVILTAGLQSPYFSLNDLTQTYCGVSLDKDIRMDFVEKDTITTEMYHYSALDVKYLKEIMELQVGTAHNEKMSQVLDLEMQLVVVVAMMEYDGVLVDMEKWISISREKEKEANKLEERFKQALIDETWGKVRGRIENGIDAYKAYRIPIPTVRNSSVERVDLNFLESLTNEAFIKKEILYVWNINSINQVKRAIKLLGVDVPNTQAKTLEKYKSESEFISDLLAYRSLAKLVSTYGENWKGYVHPVTGRIHSSFEQVGTATGRWSSNSPNLQNIPRTNEYRNLFIAREGYKILTADYSQAELRLAGVVSRELNIINAYLNGEDIHAKTASIIYNVSLDEVFADKELPEGESKEMRSKGKTINFAVIYGATAWRIAKENDNISEDEAQIFVDRLFAGYPTLGKFIKLVSDEVWKRKYSRTPFGRIRYFEDRTVFASDGERRYYIAEVKRQGVNHVIQGGSADILKMAMVEMFFNNPFGRDKFRFLIQVHDEVVVEVADEIWDEARQYLIDTMEKAEAMFLGDVPAVADCTKEKLNYWNKD